MFALSLLFIFLVHFCRPVHTLLSPTDLDAVDSFLAEHSDHALQNLTNFLKIPSVSADPSRKQSVRQAAQWLMDDLKAGGLENIQLLETQLHPAVYADWLHAPDAPTVLIYAHYDVQPEDPVELWTYGPFEPTVVDNRIYARGATDDKGNLYVAVTAVKAILSVHGKLPVNVKLFIEGEEEIGSPNLLQVLKEHAALLRSDYALSADGGQVMPDIPGICLGLRGSAGLEVRVTVANADMHSGFYGGGVQNPIHALSQLLSSLRDIETGRVLVDGFYDGVNDLSEEERQDIDAFPISEQVMMGMYGVNESYGEQGFSFLERVTLRPTLEIVGITGGFQGEGMKTVLPREASAKISTRLVYGQSGKHVLDCIKKHLKKEAQQIGGMALSLEEFNWDSDAYKTRKNTEMNKAASRVLKLMYKREAVYYNMGGSIPAISHLHTVLGVDTTIFGFGHSDERAHSPDEFGRLECFRRGERAYVRMLSEISKLGVGKDEL